MRNFAFAFVAAAFLAASVPLAAFEEAGEAGNGTGDAAIAARYASWAVAAAEEGRWKDAETALVRASDFSHASSDISYLLALARLKLDRPAGAALAAVRRALETDRWERYGRDAARIVEAGILIRLRLFDEALDSLANVADGSERAYLRAEALASAGDVPRFRSAIRLAFDAYPGDPRFARLLFDREYGKQPGDPDRALMDIAISRLPYLAGLDPTLSYRAAPFIRDIATRRRLVGTYRAMPSPDVASLPQAMELGLVDEATALAELFSNTAIDLSVFRSVWALLRDDPSRAAFAAAAAVFEGELAEDADRDGHAETVARYRNGDLVSCGFDVDQDGLDEIDIDFKDGLPASGFVAVSADQSTPGASEGPLPAMLASEEDRPRASVEWTRYPFVGRVSYEGIRYLPGPAVFPYAPMRLVPLLAAGESSAFRFPRNDPTVSRLTVRSLVSFSSAVERAGTISDGATERIELVRGIPRRAVETVEGRVVSILEFSAGHPSLRKVDMDFDGRMETVRRYRIPSRAVDPSSVLHWEEPVESVESDWNGDGIYEYAERYFNDGSVERSWDMDGDGKRERVERGAPSNEGTDARF